MVGIGYCCEDLNSDDGSYVHFIFSISRHCNKYLLYHSVVEFEIHFKRILLATTTTIQCATFYNSIVSIINLNLPDVGLLTRKYCGHRRLLRFT